MSFSILLRETACLRLLQLSLPVGDAAIAEVMDNGDFRYSALDDTQSVFVSGSDGSGVIVDLSQDDDKARRHVIPPRAASTFGESNIDTIPEALLGLYMDAQAALATCFQRLHADDL